MYEIVWTSRAILSVKNVIQFYTEIHENSKYIDKILDEIEVKENLISSMPFAGIEVTDFPMSNLRKINVLGHFSLIYRIIDNCSIDIIYFWDNRKDPKKLETIL